MPVEGERDNSGSDTSEHWSHLTMPFTSPQSQSKPLADWLPKDWVLVSQAGNWLSLPLQVATSTSTIMIINKLSKPNFWAWGRAPGPQWTDQGTCVQGRPQSGESAHHPGTMSASLHAERTLGKPHHKTQNCLNLNFMFSPVTPIFGSLVTFHLLCRRSLLVFSPGFTSVSLESPVLGSYSPQMFSNAVHVPTQTLQHSHMCLDVSTWM